jgi:integrase
VPDQRTKLGPFLRLWLDDVAKPTVRASTFSSYEGIVRLHLAPDLGRIAVAKLTPADVQRLLNAKRATGLSPRRVAYIHAVLRRALVTAERWGLASRNVAKLVDAPRVQHHEIRPLTPDAARRLIETANGDRLQALYVTALATGLRQGELLGLRWEDVDLDTRRLAVRHTLARVNGKLVLLEPKSDRSRRTLVLPEVAVAVLRAHRTRQRMERLVAGSRWHDTGHVFTTTVGTPIEAARVTRAFHGALARAGLPRGRFHDLRHAAATYLLAQGFTLEDVKNLLGHSSITLTSNTYGHVLEQRQRQIAEGMDAILRSDTLSG